MFVFILVTNPEKAQLIHPPIIIMGRTLVMFPFSISVIALESVIGLVVGAARF
jgi:hypothetical protein